MEHVYSAAKDIALNINKFKIIINKSTVPVCTGDEVEKIIGKKVKRNNFEVISNPEFLREGDELVITRIDRLARSLRDLQNIVHLLNKKGVTLVATDQPIDTSSSAGKAFLDMLGVFAEFETNLRRERQMEGIEKAKEKGVYKGRKPSINVDAVKVIPETFGFCGTVQGVKVLNTSDDDHAETELLSLVHEALTCHSYVVADDKPVFVLEVVKIFDINVHEPVPCSLIRTS